MTHATPRGRILVVDDDDEVRSALRDVLEDDGWTVVTADDGEAALAALKDDPGGVGVVLVDLMMPRLGGAGFLKRKALEPDIAGVPVVVLSAIPDLSPIPDTTDVRAVLRKPVSTVTLLEAVALATADRDGTPRLGAGDLDART